MQGSTVNQSPRMVHRHVRVCGEPGSTTIDLLSVMHHLMMFRMFSWGVIRVLSEAVMLLPYQGTSLGGDRAPVQSTSSCI